MLRQAVIQLTSIVAVIAILLLIVTMVFGLLVMNNFGRGLKEQSKHYVRCPNLARFSLGCPLVSKNKHKAGLSRGKSLYVHRGPMATHPNRMSID